MRNGEETEKDADTFTVPPPLPSLRLNRPGTVMAASKVRNNF